MIFNTFILISGIIGLFTSMIIIVNKNSNLLFNIFFYIFLLIFSLKQVLISLINIYTSSNIILLNDAAVYTVLILPIIYVYFKKLVYYNSVFTWKELLKNLIYPTLFIISIQFVVFFNPINNAFTKYFLPNLIALLFSIYYSCLSFRLLSKKIWIPEYNPFFIKQGLLIQHWTKLLFTLSISIILKFILILILAGYPAAGEFIYYYQIWPTTVLICICYKIISSPELLYGVNILEKKVNEYNKTEIILDAIWNVFPNTIPNSIQDKKLEKKVQSYFYTYVQEIEKLMIDGFFLQSNIKIADLSNKLNIPKSNLNYFFKYHCNLSFTEFKNTTRIIEATKLIKEGFLETNTLNHLSQKIGFTSYDPFYRSFKEYTGKTPAELMINYSAKSS